jgi:hypothetical protein
MPAALLIVVPLAGWLAVFVTSLIGPRPGHPGRQRAGMEAGSEPPAVVGLLAGRPDSDGFRATLLDLAARGWFSITSPAAQTTGTAVPVMCVLPAESPAEQLTSFERRAVTHLAHRTGPQQEVPAQGLADGFEGGEQEFLKAFRGEVIADTRQRGLTRPTLSTARKTMLCLLALIPAGAVVLIGPIERHSGSLIALCAFYYVVLCATAAQVSSERLTPAGQGALGAWGTRVAAMAGPRQAAYAAALGRSPAALAPFTPSDANVAWSGFADNWRLLPIASSSERVWPGISTGAFAGLVLLAVPGIPLLGVFGYVLGGGHGAELGVLTGVAGDVVIAAKAVAKWSHLPTFAEFDGLVLRQWQVGDEKSDDGIEYFVAVDDGTSAHAWAFSVDSSAFAKLPPGTLAHAKVNPRLNKLIEIQPLRRLPAAPRLAEAIDPRSRPGESGRQMG